MNLPDATDWDDNNLFDKIGRSGGAVLINGIEVVFDCDQADDSDPDMAIYEWFAEFDHDGEHYEYNGGSLTLALDWAKAETEALAAEPSESDHWQRICAENVARGLQPALPLVTA